MDLVEDAGHPLPSEIPLEDSSLSNVEASDIPGPSQSSSAAIRMVQNPFFSWAFVLFCLSKQQLQAVQASVK